METSLYLEDLSPGMQFDSQVFSVTEADIKRFALEFDPQPFHLDDAAARQTLFRGLAASGWHTAAITMRLLTSGGLPLAGGVLGMGCDITWLKPVRPGMTLRVRSTVEDVQVSKSRPGKGVVIVKSETLDESGEVVQRLVSRLLVEARGG